MAIGHRREKALTTGRPAIEPDHICICSRFIKEDKTFGVQTGLARAPFLGASAIRIPLPFARGNPASISQPRRAFIAKPPDPPVHPLTVHADEPRRFGLRLAAVQHQIDRPLAKTLLCVRCPLEGRSSPLHESNGRDPLPPTKVDLPRTHVRRIQTPVDGMRSLSTRKRRYHPGGAIVPSGGAVACTSVAVRPVIAQPT